MKNKIIAALLILLLFLCCKENKKEIEAIKTMNQSIEIVSNDSIAQPEQIKENSMDNDALEVYSFVNDPTRTLEEYRRNIAQAIKLLKGKKVLDNNMIESLIPINLKEYIEYYSISYPDNEPELFSKIDSLIIEKARENTGNCLKLYSNLAEFVDGEYAEGFFDDVLYIAQENPETFCGIFDGLSESSRARLADTHDEVCK